VQDANPRGGGGGDLGDFSSLSGPTSRAEDCVDRRAIANVSESQGIHGCMCSIGFSSNILSRIRGLRD
jgi:hypothetical protein